MMEPSLGGSIMRLHASIIALVVGASFGAQPAGAQVTKENIPGITNFARVETTVACAGATKAEAVPAIKKMGFVSIINLRQADEAGANVENEGVAAKAAGLKYFSRSVQRVVARSGGRRSLHGC